MQNLVIRLFVNAVALWVAAQLVGGIDLTEEFWPLLLVAAIFGIINALIKPLALLLSFPFLVLTLGLFTLVINGFMLWLTSALTDALHVAGFVPALLGGILISLVTFVFSLILPEAN